VKLSDSGIVAGLSVRDQRVQGSDHTTLAGATPRMLAAMAGNAPLVQALLGKGADPQRRDDFGHTV